MVNNLRLSLKKKEENMNENMISYYAKRANEYEKIYQKPERKQDIKNAINFLKKEFVNKKVLEIACGTGFWTYYISESASYVYASDINNEVIDIARSKSYPRNNVTFEKTDLYQKSNHKCDGIFGGFIWSHIPLRDMDTFLTAVHSKIKNGKIVFIDNMYVEGSSTPIVKIDGYNNSYQERRLSDGSRFLVLKNFPLKEYLYDTISKNDGKNIKINQLQYYWIASYEK